jgi:phage shock protein A
MLPSGDDAAAVADEMGDGHDEAIAVLRDQLEDTRDQLEHWRRSAEEARVAQARAEERAEAQRELVAELHKLLDGARRPWWWRWWTDRP